MTTATSDEARYLTQSRAAGVAALIATVLASVGAVATIVGAGGVLGFFDIDAMHTASLIGVGLIAMGAGALLLVVLQAWRITR